MYTVKWQEAWLSMDWKEAVTPQFEKQTQNLSGGNEENHKNLPGLSLFHLRLKPGTSTLKVRIIITCATLFNTTLYYTSHLEIHII